ncbi:hypothetical protein VTN77DRAFT_273 [Rasamsonia byssochlamydoides]|uniref:uncharacterized protein n=1 Tax=Rasamsonia byssochlamydoides TaxID=89139 RepID=UPI00374282F4
MSSGGLSNVGARFLYEADDQRTVSRHEINERRRYKEGEPGSNEPYRKDPPEELVKKDPTLPAQLHGYEPSKGAKIDKELKQEDELRKQEKGYK